MATHTRSQHTRRTQSGGTTTVRRTQVHTRGAKVADDIRNRSMTGRTYAALAGITLGSVVFGVLQALWATGGAITVAVGSTIVFMVAAERYGFMDRRTWRYVRRRRPHYRGLRTQAALWRTKSSRAYRRYRNGYRRRHPIQTALWQRYGAKWEVTLQEPEAAAKKAGRKTPRTTTRYGRGHRGRSQVSNEARRHGWSTVGVKEVQR
jgi:hypothetical protein